MTSPTVAEHLLAQLTRVLGRRQAALEFKWMRDLAADSAPTLQGMAKRRLRGEPLQYILRTQPFGPLDLRVRPPVLIPRPETEDWTLRLARRLSPSPQAPFKLLDLCTGTGCIPLLLCHLWSAGTVHALGVDITSEAVALAKENAEHVGVRVLDRTGADSDENSFTILQSDMLDGDFPRTLRELGWSAVDVLTSNPPYIPLHEYNVLPSSVKEYEDPRALLGDPSPERAKDGRGLTFYRAIAELVRGELVKAGGLIALEVGHDQSAEVQQLMLGHAHVQRTEVWTDPWGVARTVVCWR